MDQGQKRRVVFMGTPAFAAPILKALLDSENYEVTAVYTRPDKKAGRGLKTAFSEVKKIALERNLPVYQPASFKSAESVGELEALAPDYLVVAAYGLILPQRILDIPKIAPINVHASLLPSLRGAAPIQRAIMENPGAGSVTGVSIMEIRERLDAGPVYASKEVAIERKDYKELEADLSRVGASLLVKVLDAIEKDGLKPVPQDDSKASYANKIEKADGRIDWTKTAAEVDALARALSSWPGAHTVIHPLSGSEKTLVTILGGRPGEECEEAPGTIFRNKNALSIACKDRWYEVEKLRPQGRKLMNGADFANGQFKIRQGVCGHAGPIIC